MRQRVSDRGSDQHPPGNGSRRRDRQRVWSLHYWLEAKQDVYQVTKVSWPYFVPWHEDWPVVVADYAVVERYFAPNIARQTSFNAGERRGLALSGRAASKFAGTGIFGRVLACMRSSCVPPRVFLFALPASELSHNGDLASVCFCSLQSSAPGQCWKAVLEIPIS